MMSIEDAARFHTELELDRNRFLLIRKLLEQGDTKGAGLTCDVALDHLRTVLGPHAVNEHAPS